MSRTVKEWVGRTDDTPPPPRVRDRVFAKFGGKCPKCSRKLRAGHWDCDHVQALKNGGKNRESNLQPLCNSPCHPKKTAEDVAEKASVYAKRSKHIGVKRRRRTIPGQKFDGTPIPSRWV